MRLTARLSGSVYWHFPSLRFGKCAFDSTYFVYGLNFLRSPIIQTFRQRHNRFFLRRIFGAACKPKIKWTLPNWRGVHQICVKKTKAGTVKKRILFERSEFILFRFRLSFLANWMRRSAFLLLLLQDKRRPRWQAKPPASDACT